MKLICLDTFPATLHHEYDERQETLTEVQDFETGDLLGYLAPEMVAPVVNTLQACHGLDLPDEVTPGLLAELVTAARGYSDARAFQDEEMAKPGPLTLAMQERRRISFRQTMEALAGLRAILAKLTPIPGNISENKVD